MAPKSIKKVKEVKKYVPAFEKDKPLQLDDVTCKICFSVFLDPVTFPCDHSVCKACFEVHFWETSMKCPFCNLRIANWSRSRKTQKKNLVNLAFKERIEREFPEEVKSLMTDEEKSEVGQDNQYDIRVRDINSLLEHNEEEEDVKIWDGQFCEPGAIAKDLEILYQKHRLDLEKEQEDELNASKILIEQIIKEEEMEMKPMIVSQIQSDFELAQRLQHASPPKLRSNSPPTLPPNRAGQFNLITHQVIKNETPIGQKHRQSYPAALPLKRKKSNCFAQKHLSKKSRSKQRKMVDFFEDTKLLPSESEARESSVPPDVLIVQRQEEVRIKAEQRCQELEDMKFALELQEAYDANSSIRGKKGRISEKYSIRNWMRSPQA